MRIVAIGAVGCVVVIASLGCLGGVGPGEGAGPGQAEPRGADSADAGGNTGNAYVIERAELVSDDRTVLAVMVGRIPNMRVERTGRCPRIAFRGAVIEAEVSNPLVYIDGTRATDTCVLDGLSASDMRLVEVYPTGRTTRAGYATSAHGLILLFSRRR